MNPPPPPLQLKPSIWSNSSRSSFIERETTFLCLNKSTHFNEVLWTGWKISIYFCFYFYFQDISRKNISLWDVQQASWLSPIQFETVGLALDHLDRGFLVWLLFSLRLFKETPAFFKFARARGGEPGIFLIFVYFLTAKQRLRPLGHCSPTKLQLRN